MATARPRGAPPRAGPRGAPTRPATAAALGGGAGGGAGRLAARPGGGRWRGRRRGWHRVAGSGGGGGAAAARGMHRQRVDVANPGDNVGLSIKGLDKHNMPRSGDGVVYKKDTVLGQTREFDAQIQVLDIPDEITIGLDRLGGARARETK